MVRFIDNVRPNLPDITAALMYVFEQPLTEREVAERKRVASDKAEKCP